MKYGWDALEEIKSELEIENIEETVYYQAYNKLSSKCIKGELDYNDITKDAIIKEAEKIKSSYKTNWVLKNPKNDMLTSTILMGGALSEKKYNDDTKEADKPIITPHEFSKMKARGEKFYDLDTKTVLDDVFAPALGDNKTMAFTEDGKVVEVDIRKITKVPENINSEKVDRDELHKSVLGRVLKEMEEPPYDIRQGITLSEFYEMKKNNEQFYDPASGKVLDDVFGFKPDSYEAIAITEEGEIINVDIRKITKVPGSINPNSGFKL